MCLRDLSRAALLVLCVCCVAAAQPQCSLHDLVGVWAYSGIGWVVYPGQSTAVPVSMIGIAVIDYSGRITGPGTITNAAPIPGTPIPAGQPLDWEFVGDTPVKVNPDCTAVLSYAVQVKGMPGPLPGYIDRMIVLANTGEILGMGVASPLSKPMLVYTMKRISHVPTPVSWPTIPPPAQ